MHIYTHSRTLKKKQILIAGENPTALLWKGLGELTVTSTLSIF